MQLQYGQIYGEVHSEIILLPVYRSRAGVCLNQYCVFMFWPGIVGQQGIPV